MVGNMVGSQLAMAPAFVLGQLCDVVDLDGPVFLRARPQPSATYEDGRCGARLACGAVAGCGDGNAGEQLAHMRPHDSGTRDLVRPAARADASCS